MSGGTSATGMASAFTQGAGTVASAYGAYSKGKAEQTAYQLQALVARNNAEMADWQATDAMKRGVTAVNTHQMKVAQLRGTQRASMAARGIDLGQGSALDILTDTEFMGAIDANTIKDNAEKEAWGYRMQAANYTSNSQLLNLKASNTNPGMDAASTFLTGASGVAKNWYSLKEKTG